MATPATANEVLTIEEIKKKYDSEWVLIANPKTDEHFSVLSGKVIHHHPDRTAFDRDVLKLNPHPTDFAVLYTGKPPEGVSYLL
ncbi:MAG TPA: hypothetical protein PLD20_33135 [Blastocatellia bacterium]|nr:hypothetical protein [Blastocatellia bacterium]HMV83824.1 hypothetical protein [Blastocatellia bacterium]HMX27218.1 hypothetical protein [Blastocatellia bacterium]HMY71739.1 hypothetical protein [Blastocatellia bacterium]HMZ22819.1 hypothetical protein [Blastocatellia bacterium]